MQGSPPLLVFGSLGLGFDPLSPFGTILGSIRAGSLFTELGGTPIWGFGAITLNFRMASLTIEFLLFVTTVLVQLAFRLTARFGLVSQFRYSSSGCASQIFRPVALLQQLQGYGSRLEGYCWGLGSVGYSELVVAAHQKPGHHSPWIF